MTHSIAIPPPSMADPAAATAGTDPPPPTLGAPTTADVLLRNLLAETAPWREKGPLRTGVRELDAYVFGAGAPGDGGVERGIVVGVSGGGEGEGEEVNLGRLVGL